MRFVRSLWSSPAVLVGLAMAFSPPAGAQQPDTLVATDTLISAATGRTERIEELGTAVGRFDSEALHPASISNMADLLTGRTTGLVVQDVSGTVGTAQRIRIRGANSLSLSNEPLIFVDGMRINTGFKAFGLGGQEPSRLNDLNPLDVADVRIVKGPAALALYGADAAGGVILITTKRGVDGPTQWEFFAESGVLDDITDYPANYAALEVVDPGQPIVNPSGTFSTNATDWCPNLRAAERLCRQDERFRFNTLTDPRTRLFSQGNRSRYGAAVRGGNEDVRYFLSGQVEDATGVVFFNTQETVRLRANLDADLADNAALSLSFGYTDRDLALNNNDNSIFSPILQGLQGYPNFVEKPDDATYEGPNPSNYSFGYNLPALSQGGITRQNTDRFFTGGRLQWRPSSWLTLQATGGLDLASVFDFETDNPRGGPCPTCLTRWIYGFRNAERSRAVQYTAGLGASGSFDLSTALHSTTSVGVQFDQQERRSTFCSATDLAPSTASCGASARVLRIDEAFFQEKALGFYVQQEFSFRDRLFLNTGVRSDRASTFGSDVGFVHLPWAQLSWLASEESFFPEVDVLSRLRVRGGWGRTGQRPDFRSAGSLYGPIDVALPDGDVAGVSLAAVGNRRLRPEITAGYEVGFDAALFDDRLAVDFTWFDRETTDALLDRSLPPSLGLGRCSTDGRGFGSVNICPATTRLENVGRITNSGTELALRAEVLRTDRVGLTLGFLNSTLDNEVRALGQGIDPVVFNRDLQRHEARYPAGGFWQRDVTWEDDNGDGFIGCSELFTGDPADGCEVEVADQASYIGSAMPTWQRTVFADLRLFDWITVSTLFEGRGGHFTGNDSEAFRCGFRSTRGCRAVGDPTAPLQEQAAYIADRFLGSAAGYVEKADFWRWRELSVALDVPTLLSSRVRALDGMRLTLAGRNLATFTGYDGLDPETNEAGGDSNFSQSEFNSQPPVRYLVVRLDYRF